MNNFLFGVAKFMTDVESDEVYSEATAALNKAYETFKQVVTTILPIAIAVVLILGMFFGISLGIKFAKAEDADAREKVKGQLINLAIGIGVAAVILIVVNVLVANNVFKNISWFK